MLLSRAESMGLNNGEVDGGSLSGNDCEEDIRVTPVCCMDECDDRALYGAVYKIADRDTIFLFHVAHGSAGSESRVGRRS